MAAQQTRLGRARCICLSEIETPTSGSTVHQARDPLEGGPVRAAFAWSWRISMAYMNMYRRVRPPTFIRLRIRFRHEA